jgi:protein-S-isoprenylcysteine O-methyltransferase Ste14
MPVTLLSSILFITFIKYYHGGFSLYGLGIVGVYIAWILFEMTVSVKDFSESHASFDKLTREGYAVSQFLVITSAIYLSNPSGNTPILIIISYVVTLIGIFIRVYSVRYLGIYYSHEARLITDHKVISTGPYSLIRHPAYLGMIIIHIGVVLAFYNYVTLFIFLFLFILFLVIRIFIEEEMLLQLDGYKEYSLSHKRLIPFVW